MTVLGLDCDAPLNASAIPVQYRFVARYIAPHDNPLTKAEVASYTAKGLGIVALCEHSITDVAGGAGGGASNARTWLAEAKALGMPAGSVLIFACDEDPSSVEVATAVAYYRAVTTACRADKYLGGAYGGHDLMVTLGNVVDVLMQAAGWSGGKGVATGVDISQTLQQVTIGGVACDVDQAFATHFGAFNGRGLWPAPVPVPTPPIPQPEPESDDVTIERVAVTAGANGQGSATHPYSFAKVVSWSVEGGAGPHIIVAECSSAANGQTIVTVKGAAPAQVVTVRLGVTS